MIRKFRFSYVLAILVSVFFALAMLPRFLYAAEPGQEGLQEVWSRVRESGAYEFSSDLRQVETPLPTAVNAGREGSETAVHIDGRTDINDDSMYMTLWSNGGSIMTPEKGVEFKLENGRSYARKVGGRWQPAGDIVGSFAPGGDMLAYLHAADNVVRHEPELRRTPLGNLIITRYTFDINGYSFAYYMKNQFQQQDGLPPGMAVELPKVYADMTGTGELWVGGDGLPLRQQFELHFPDRNDTSTSMDVTVNFSNFAPVPLTSTLNALGSTLSGMLHQDLTPRGFLPFPATLATLVFVTLLLRRRQTKRLYNVVALLIVISMLFSPLISSVHVAAYSAEQITKQKSQDNKREEQEAREKLMEELLNPSFDPHTDPLQQARLRQSKIDGLQQARPAEDITSSTSNDSKYFDSSCETDPNTDADGDGLTNLEECLVGTLPGTADTDGDLLDDGTEIRGAIIVSQDTTSKTWYTDPLNMDTNYDGISDGSEWLRDQNADGIPDDTDADGTPDIWDDDNDGDGVPDDLDLSPYSTTQDLTPYNGQNPLLLSINNLASGQLVKVEFQIAPTNADHLWYTNNVLDWPDNDLQGQIQDSDGATFYSLDNTLDRNPNDNGDMRLIPMLEIEITGDNDNLPSADILNQFGISVVQSSTDTQTAYVPAQLVTDSRGNKNVAFSGTMFYRAGDTWGNAQPVRLVWLVQALVDQCGEFTNNICTSYDALNQEEIIQAYDEEWHLTGMHVTEEHGTTMDIIYEDPVATEALQAGYDKPYYMDTLYGLLYGLDNSFLAGRDCDAVDATGECVGDGQLDITATEITRRFNHETNSAVSEEERWGLPNVLDVVQNNYEAFDLAAYDTSVTQTVKVLNDQFTGFWSAAEPITPTIMFAYQEQYRSLNMDQGFTGSPNFALSGSNVNLDLPSTGANPVSLNTKASVKWTPYAYDAVDGWYTADIQEYYDELTLNLASSFADITDPEEAETYQTMAQQIYITTFNGEENIIAIDSENITQDYQKADSNIYFSTTTKVGSIVRSVASFYFIYTPTLEKIAAQLRAEGNVASAYSGNTLSAFIAQKWAQYTSDAIGIAKLTALGIFAVIAAVGLFMLYVLQDTSQPVRIVTAVGVGGFLLLYSILKPFFALVGFVSKAETFGEGLGNLLADAEVIGRSGKAAVIGLIISVLIAIGVFIYVWAEGKASPGTIAFNQLIAYTIASIIVAMIIFVLTLTAVGSILVSIISAIDLILFFLGIKWSITGWITGVIAGAIYNYKNIVKYDVEAGNLSTDLTDPLIGTIAGNSMAYSMPVTTTITGTNQFQTRDFWSNSLDYKLSQDKVRFETSIGARTDDWTGYAKSKGLEGVINDTVVLTETLRAGVNVPASLWLNSAYALRGQSCWLGFCDEKYIKGSSSENLGATVIFDVLPATVEEFVDTAWSGGQVGNLDKDGDGLLPSYAGGIDPDDNNWDTDGDNLSDAYELTISGQTPAEGGVPLDPQRADTDGDSLRDDLELLYGTNPGLVDTDDDGISDVLEVGPDGGWFLAYSPTSFTRAWSSPRSSDFDGDGMSDLFERTQDTCPSCKPWVDPTNPLIFSPAVWNESPVALYVDDDSTTGFVSPGASLVYTTTTTNNLSGGQDLVGELTLDPSTGFSGAPLAAQVDITAGDSESLVSNLTSSFSGSGAHVLTSQMDLNDIAIISWSWSDTQSNTANVQKGNAIKPAIAAVPGWNQPYLVALHEKQNNVSYITTHTASSDGRFASTGTSAQSSSGSPLTAPAIACTDKGTCLVIYVEPLGGGVSGVASMQFNGGLSSPGANFLWIGNNTNMDAPDIASDGSDFMIAFMAQSGGQTQVLLEQVGSGGDPSGSPTELTSSSGDIGDLAIDWAGDHYLAIWREGANLYRAKISSSGEVNSKTLIGPGTGWMATDGSEEAPDLVFDARSQQSLLLYRAVVDGNVQLHGIRVDENGESSASVLATDSVLSQDGVSTAVCADPKNGGWVVAWALPGQTQVAYQALSQDGSMRGTTNLMPGDGSQGIALACTWPTPVADFKFDEDAGATSFADSSSNGYTFICQDSQCPTAGVSGQTGNAIQFDGADDKIVSNFPQNNSTFTTELWFRTSDQSAIIFTRESGYKRLYLQNGSLCASTKTLVSDQSTVNEICSSDLNYADDTWHQVAHVGLGNAHSLYIDGVLQATAGSIKFEPCSNCTGFTLAPDSGYSGLIDDLRFYNRALSGLEISDAFSSAIAIYDLDEAAGVTTTVDAAGNGFDGECSGVNCPTFGVPGVSYTAAQFDGSNDYITINPAKKVDATYTYDFESGAGSEWSSTRTAPATREGEQTTFLGTFLNETVTLALQDLPPHDTIEVAFDLYVLGEWAGNSTADGPDNWEWGYDITPVLNTNFSNRPVGSAGSYQLYPAPSWNFSGIKLYSDENCNKNELIVTQDIPHLGDTTIGNNTVSCYERPTDTIAVLYKDGNYGGDSWVVDPGRGLFPDIPKNDLSSVRVWAKANAPKQGAIGDTLEVGGFGTTTSIYRLTATIENHTESTISLYFKGLNPTSAQNQWAVDNVVVSALSDSSSLPLTDSSFTIAAWTKYTGQGNDSMILSQGSAQGSQGLQFGYRAGNQFVCGFWIDDLVTTESYPSTDWQHWACTYGYYPSRVRTIYHNGVQVTQDISTGYSGFGPTYIGQLFGGKRRFKGTIDEVGIWQRALSAAEIAELYDQVKIADASVIEGLSPVTSSDSQITLNNMTLRETATVLGSDSQTMTRTVTIDADAPVANIQVPGNGEIIRGQGQSTFQVLGSASDATSSISSVQVKLDNGTWQSANGTGSWHYTVDLDALNEGAHTISVRAADLLGRMGSTKSVQFILDRTPPNVQSQTPSNRPTRDDQGRWIATLSGTVSDSSGVSSVEVLLQGSQDLSGQGWQTAEFSGNNWSLDYVLPPFGVDNRSQNDPSGSYGLFLRAADSVGNETQNPAQSRTLVLDAAAPFPTLTNPLTTTTLITTALTFRGDIMDDGSVSGVEFNLTPAEQIDALSGNILHLPLDENQPTEYFADQSGSNHAAVCSMSACPAVNQSGRRDQAVSFDGQDDTLAIEAGDLLNFATDQDFAVTLWLTADPDQPDQSVTRNEIMGKGSGAIVPFAVRFQNQSGQIEVLRSDGSNSPRLTSTSTVTDGQFHHIAFIKSGSTLALYIDGVLEASTADTTTGTTTNNSAVYVGSKGDGTAHFKGRLDEITVYNRALADYEVSSLNDYGFGTWATAPQNKAEWSYTLPQGASGIEGIFQLNVRGTDAVGNVTPLSNQNMWRGEIDTRPPSLNFSAVLDNTGSATATTFTCLTSDLNLDLDTSCQPVSPAAVPVFRSSDMTLTDYNQVNPWFAATITDTTRLYTIDATRIYSATQDTSGSLQVCDAYKRCTTSSVSNAALSVARVEVVDPAAEFLDPTSGTVLKNLSPVTISGHAFASASLQDLVVNVDGTAAHNQNWATGAVTDTSWSFSWTPPAEGKYLFDTKVTDWNGATATAQRPATIWVDMTAPTVTISPTLLSQADLIAETTVNLTGMAVDSVQVERVEVSIDGGPWQRTGLDASGVWQFPWNLGAPVDGQSFNVQARAVDHAGWTSEIESQILVDTVAPEPGAILLTAVSSGGKTDSLVVGTTYSDAETLRLEFAAGHDGSGIDHYQAGFTPARFEDPANLTNYAGANTHQQPAGEATAWYAHLNVVDSAGNSTIRNEGPFYVDTSLTPDLVSIIDYQDWTENFCTVQGIDRRLAYNHPGTNGDDLQQFFVSWDETNLRLNWQGAHWESGGDLFIYLDTRPGGADRLYNPNANDEMTIYFPGNTPDPQYFVANAYAATQDRLSAGRPAMQADFMVWIEDAGQAALWRWDGSGWQTMGALEGDRFEFGGGVDNGRTDILLSFASLGILDPASAALGLLAVATDEDALRLWATMPPRNPLSSAKVVNPIAAHAKDYTYALSRAYFWDGLGPGQCANGRLNGDGSGPAGSAFADSDLHLTLTADPVGTTYSFLADELSPVWALIFGYKHVPVTPSMLFDFMDTDHPLIGIGDTVNYTIHYKNMGSETATNVEIDLTSIGALKLSQQSLDLGDIPAGTSGSVQFKAQVTASSEDEAAYEQCLLFFPADFCDRRRRFVGVTALAYDDQSPRQSGQGLWSSAPMEWLFGEHFVDITGPETIMINTPDHVISGRQMIVQGTVYDESAVPKIKLEWRVNGGMIQSQSCIKTIPKNSKWQCVWDPGNVVDGAVVEIRAQGIDAFGQEGAWSGWKDLTVDKTPPTIAIDPGVDGQTFGEGLHIVSGTASDDHGVSAVQICVEGERCVKIDVQRDGTWSTYLPQINHTSPDGLEHIIQVYAFDHVGNRSAEPITLTYWLDTTPPNLTVTKILEEVSAGNTESVLEGTASDGSDFNVFILLTTPAGRKQRFKTNANNGTWAFYHHFSEVGTYQVQVQAIDIAGNGRTAGTYGIHYLGGSPMQIYYFPIMFINR